MRKFQAAILVFSLLFAILHSTAAFSASLTVAVSQVNLAGTAQIVTCNLLAPNCDLPFVINAGQSTQQPLTIHVVYYAGGLGLTFKTTGGYFHAGKSAGKISFYNTLWNASLQGSTPTTYTVSLFQPLDSLPLHSPPLTTPGSFVASLQITATPVP